jgi:hypothetical protein
VSETEPPSVGQLSADGRWRWDGHGWVITDQLSPDGRWRWDGLAWQPVAEASAGSLAIIQPEHSSSDVLQASVMNYVRAGYRVVNQTPASVQLMRPKTFSFLWATAWFLLCGVGVLVYIFYYMGKKDEQTYLSVDQYGRLRWDANRRF